MGAKTAEFALPLPGRRAGLALSKAGWGQAQNHSQRSTARLNQCRAAGMTDLQQGKATIRSWGVPTEPANDKKRRNLHKCNLGISCSVDVDQATPPKAFPQNRTQKRTTSPNGKEEQPWGVHIEPANDRKTNAILGLLVLWVLTGQPHQKHLRTAGGISKPHADQCLRTKSRANDFPAVPRAAATAGSSRPAAPLVHQGRYMALPSASPESASAGPLRSPSASAEWG